MTVARVRDAILQDPFIDGESTTYMRDQEINKYEGVHLTDHECKATLLALIAGLGLKLVRTTNGLQFEAQKDDR